MTFQQLKEKISSLSNGDAIEQLDIYISSNPESEEAYTLRGMKHWGCGHRSLAINDYLTAIRINPDSKARQALKVANEILDYRNKDLYNP